MAVRVIGVRQLRDDLAGVLDQLGEIREIVVTQRGEGKAALVDLQTYNDLIDRIEYLEDSLDALSGDKEHATPVDQIDWD